MSRRADYVGCTHKKSPKSFPCMPNGIFDSFGGSIWSTSPDGVSKKKLYVPELLIVLTSG